MSGTGWAGESFTTSTTIDLATGNITAPGFIGPLTGDVTGNLEGTAKIATYDNTFNPSGTTNQTIAEKYVMGLDAVVDYGANATGTSLYYTKGDGHTQESTYIPELWRTAYTIEDVDTLKIPGRYIISNPTSYSYYDNLPQVYGLSNATWQIEVKNINQIASGSSLRVEQQAHTIYYKTSNVYADFKFCRYYLSSRGWSPWVRETPYVAERIFATSSSAFNLNNLITPGRYACGANIMNYVTNKPVATTGKGWEITVRELVSENDQYLLQEARDASNIKYWRTTNNGSTGWTDWTQENQISMASELTSSALTINLYQENNFASAVSFPVATTTAVPIYSGQTN